jgi:fibronectin-binding autotransporter adhesin
MATWDGFFSTDFLAPINWVGGILPNQDSSAVIDSTGAGAQFNPALSSGQSASVFTLEQSDRTFTVQGTLTVNAGAILSGAGSSAGILIIANTGTVSVSGNGLAVTGGTLNNFGTLGSTLQVFGGAVNNAGVITGAVTVSGGSLNLNNGTDLSDSATLTVNGGTVNVNRSENVGLLAGTGGAIAIGATHFLTVGAVGNSSFAGVISGDGGLTKDGSGTLTLTGANTYSGATTISEGTLVVTNAAGLGTTAAGTTVANNATLQLDLANLTTTNEAITLNGAGLGGIGALRHNAATGIAVFGQVTLASNSQINSDTATAGGGLQFTGPGITGVNTNLTTGGAGDIQINNAITTGTGALIKNGTGSLVINGANTFTGATTVNAGSLLVSGGSALSDTALLTVNAPGTVALNTAETVGGLAGNGVVQLQVDPPVGTGIGSVLTIATASGSNTFSGVISGTAAGNGLTKTGAGTQILTGNNTYTGTTTISAGTLQVGAGGGTGTLGSGAVVNNGALVFEVTGIGRVVANAISGTGALTVTGGGLLPDGHQQLQRHDDHQRGRHLAGGRGRHHGHVGYGCRHEQRGADLRSQRRHHRGQPNLGDRLLRQVQCRHPDAVRRQHLYRHYIGLRRRAEHHRRAGLAERQRLQQCHPAG